MEEQDRFLRIAKSLAGNDNQRRVQALQLVEMWLTTHASQVDHVELAKLCKSLFYSIWLSDDPETSEYIIHQVARFMVVGTSKYFLALLECIGNLWPKLDIYRLDKFYNLVTSCLNELANLGTSQGWKDETVQQLGIVLLEQCTQHWIHTSRGLVLHVLDKYYELIQQAISSLLSSTDTLEQKADDLWSVFHIPVDDAVQTDKLFATRVKERIFIPFIQQCKTAAKEQRYELLYLVRQWLCQLYAFASSPQRPNQSRKHLYALYNRLKEITMQVKTQDEIPSFVVRRSQRLKTRSNTNGCQVSSQVVKQVRFSLERNEEYVLPAIRKRRSNRIQSMRCGGAI